MDRFIYFYVYISSIILYRMIRFSLLLMVNSLVKINFFSGNVEASIIFPLLAIGKDIFANFKLHEAK